jgi:hypothetical protein
MPLPDKFQQSNTGVIVQLPITPALQDVIAATTYVGANSFLVTE